MQKFQVLRVLEPALRMKAHTDSYSRGQKDFICREEKDCTLGNARGPKTGDPLDQGGEWGFIAFFALPEGGDAFQMQTGFPREEKCLLDHLSPFGTSCSLSFSSPSQWWP
jgi:hypothetical protein